MNRDLGEGIGTLLVQGDVAEMRIRGTHKGIVSGYYDDFKQLAEDAERWSGHARRIAITINPVRDDLLARSRNHLTQYARHITGDTDILRRRWLLINCEPRRPAGISATDEEHQAALDKAEDIQRFLAERAWPDPCRADSGNGAHLLVPLDLPNDASSVILLRQVLDALAFLFDDDAVQIDRTTFNAARLCRLYGTLAARGDSTTERPHRLARLLWAPDSREPVPVEALEAVAALLPTLAPRHSPAYRGCNGRDLDRWIAGSGLSMQSCKEWNGGRKWVLNPCPWNSLHVNGSAYIVQFAGGAIAAGCPQEGCRGKDWHALRDLVEPGWRQWTGTQALSQKK